jgi:hypothetical protein
MDKNKENSIIIEGIGEIIIPPRNTKEDILKIVKKLREADDSKTLHELLTILPLKKDKGENIWCLHNDCLESTRLFKNETALQSHTMAIHGRKK